MRVLLALACLASLLSSCGLRSMSPGSSSGSFTRNITGFGALEGGYWRYDQQAGAEETLLTLPAETEASNFALRLVVFQDINADSVYSPGADRELASQEGVLASSGDALRLGPAAFHFREIHEPLGIAWVLRDPSGRTTVIPQML